MKGGGRLTCMSLYNDCRLVIGVWQDTLVPGGKNALLKVNSCTIISTEGMVTGLASSLATLAFAELTPLDELTMGRGLA